MKKMILAISLMLTASLRLWYKSMAQKVTRVAPLLRIGACREKQIIKAQISKLILQSMLGFNLCIAAYSGSAAAQECANLPEEVCGRVETAISNWQTLFRSSARVEGWEYHGEGERNVDFLIPAAAVSDSWGDFLKARFLIQGGSLGLGGSYGSCACVA